MFDFRNCYHQVQHHDSSILSGPSADPKTAPVGINPVCAIGFVGTNGSLANIANIIACGLSIIFVVYLIWATSRRKAAVGESASSRPCALGVSSGLGEAWRGVFGGFLRVLWESARAMSCRQSGMASQARKRQRTDGVQRREARPCTPCASHSPREHFADRARNSYAEHAY